MHGSDIAGELGVSRPTVSVALRALAEEGYVFADDGHEIHLTEKGKRIAEDTYERHSTFCRLLTGLGVDEKTAAADACEMEHAGRLAFAFGICLFLHQLQQDRRCGLW